MLSKRKLIPTNKLSDIKNVDIIIICLPTPLSHYKPDLSFKKGFKSYKNYLLNNPKLIILEFTTYPGTTDELFIKNFKKNLIDGEDYLWHILQKEKIPVTKILKLKQYQKLLVQII